MTFPTTFIVAFTFDLTPIGEFDDPKLPEFCPPTILPVKFNIELFASLMPVGELIKVDVAA